MLAAVTRQPQAVHQIAAWRIETEPHPTDKATPQGDSTSNSNPQLPGRLGNPDAILADDERADPRLRAVADTLDPHPPDVTPVDGERVLRCAAGSLRRNHALHRGIRKVVVAACRGLW